MNKIKNILISLFLCINFFQIQLSASQLEKETTFVELFSLGFRASDSDNDKFTVIVHDGLSLAYSKITGEITDKNNNDKKFDLREVRNRIRTEFRAYLLRIGFVQHPDPNYSYCVYKNYEKEQRSCVINFYDERKLSCTISAVSSEYKGNLSSMMQGVKNLQNVGISEIMKELTKYFGQENTFSLEGELSNVVSTKLPEPEVITTMPSVEQPDLVIEQPKPVIEKPKPVARQPDLVIEQPKPVVEEPKPVIEQPKPVVENKSNQINDQFEKICMQLSDNKKKVLALLSVSAIMTLIYKDYKKSLKQNEQWSLKGNIRFFLNLIKQPKKLWKDHRKLAYILSLSLGVLPVFFMI